MSLLTGIISLLFFLLAMVITGTGPFIIITRPLMKMGSNEAVGISLIIAGFALSIPAFKCMLQAPLLDLEPEPDIEKDLEIKEPLIIHV